MTIDGYIDDTSATRLLLSNEADFDRVDAVRADHDAILVGATTIRRDNPRLLIRADHRRHQCEAAGQPPNPIKVTLTRTGDLDRPRRQLLHHRREPQARLHHHRHRTQTRHRARAARHRHRRQRNLRPALAARRPPIGDVAFLHYGLT